MSKTEFANGLTSDKIIMDTYMKHQAIADLRAIAGRGVEAAKPEDDLTMVTKSFEDYIYECVFDYPKEEEIAVLNSLTDKMAVNCSNLTTGRKWVEYEDKPVGGVTCDYVGSDVADEYATRINLTCIRLITRYEPHSMNEAQAIRCEKRVDDVIICQQVL